MSNEAGRVKRAFLVFLWPSGDTPAGAQLCCTLRELIATAVLVFCAPTALLGPFHFIVVVRSTKHVFGQSGP